MFTIISCLFTIFQFLLPPTTLMLHVDVVAPYILRVGTTSHQPSIQQCLLCPIQGQKMSDWLHSQSIEEGGGDCWLHILLRHCKQQNWWSYRWMSMLFVLFKDAQNENKICRSINKFEFWSWNGIHPQNCSHFKNRLICN